MISGIDLKATIDFTLKDDTDNPTIFKLGILPSYLLGRMSDNMESENKIVAAYKLLQLSIKGWSNFNVEYATAEEEFYGRKLQVVPISILEQLPIDVITELATKCIELNKLTAAERKN